MGGGAARRLVLHVARDGDQLLQPGDIESALRRHARNDADAAHGNVGVLVRNQDGGADRLVAAAGRIGAVDAREHRNARLLELGVPEKGRARTAAVGIELLLVGKLHAAAVHQPHQRDVQPLGQIGHAQDVIGLSGDPGAGKDLVVEADDHGPAAADLAQAVDHVGRALFVVQRVVEAVQRLPGARIDQVFQPLPHGQSAAFVDLGRGYPDFLHRLLRRGDLGFDGLQLRAALLRARDAVFLQRFAEAGHFFEIRSHACSFICVA